MKKNYAKCKYCKGIWLIPRVDVVKGMRGLEYRPSTFVRCLKCGKMFQLEK